MMNSRHMRVLAIILLLVGCESADESAPEKPEPPAAALAASESSEITVGKAFVVLDKGRARNYYFTKQGGAIYTATLVSTSGDLDLSGHWNLDRVPKNDLLESNNPGSMIDTITITSTKESLYFLTVYAYTTGAGALQVDVEFAPPGSSVPMVMPCRDCGHPGDFDREWMGDGLKHLAKDYPAFVDDGVVAVADGNVICLGESVSGFGGDNPSRSGPAFWIRSKKANGDSFSMLYGHATPIKCGENVRAGEVVGYVTPYYVDCPFDANVVQCKNWSHLHFGIWDSDVAEPTSALGYGTIRQFVDPEPFLKSTSYMSQ